MRPSTAAQKKTTTPTAKAQGGGSTRQKSAGGAAAAKAKAKAQTKVVSSATNVVSSGKKNRKAAQIRNKAKRGKTASDNAAKAEAAHEAEVLRINSPGAWTGLPMADGLLPIYGGMGDANVNGTTLPPLTAKQQTAISGLGFDYRIQPGQPVACHEVRDGFGDKKLYLTLHLIGPRAIHRFVCPLCGLALRPHSFPKHFGKGGKCEAKVLQPAVYQHVTETQKVGENV